MAFYIVRYNGGFWVNDELGKKAIAGGEHSFLKMVATCEVVSENILDQPLYMVTKEAAQEYLVRYSAQFQDFDAQYRQIHVLTQEEHFTAEELEEQKKVNHARVRRIHLPKDKLIRHRLTTFIPLRYYHSGKGDLREDRKHMALVQVCKYLYLALNAVNVAVEKPVIVLS
jgi:hypothetical protein